MGTGKALKPRILCLHGGGTSSLIFRIQARQLQQLLHNHVDFVYHDAPFECRPGPGVLPTFEGAGPFFKWTSGDDEPPTDEGPFDFVTIDESIRRLRDEIGPFEGIFAFSQGVRVAATLLSRAQRSLDSPQGHELNDQNRDFRFAIFVGGTFPPLHDGEIPAPLQASAARIHLPTIHVLGSDDPFRLESLKMLNLVCEPKSTTIISFKGKHEIPSHCPDIKILADHIRKLVERRS
jgi:Serine hydrolase (FSH1)